eukprot:scaffold91032_cov102-Phaeocystis_antarctica.AAC.1
MPPWPCGVAVRRSRERFRRYPKQRTTGYKKRRGREAAHRGSRPARAAPNVPGTRRGPTL